MQLSLKAEEQRIGQLLQHRIMLIQQLHRSGVQPIGLSQLVMTVLER